MKRKDKVIPILGLSVLICSLFLVTIPITAIAAGQDDYALGIYGNANEDDTIDMRDLTYVKLIFFGKKPETELADAKYDGKINPLDFIQIKLIIVGKEKELTVIDCQDRGVTVSMPVERVIGVNTGAVEILRALGVDIGEKMVGVTTYILTNPQYWQELQDKPGIVYGSPDYEQIAELNPDIVILYSSPYKDESIEKYEEIGVTVLCLDCHDSRRLDEDVKILGEIFTEKVKSEEFINWYHKYDDLIIDRTSSLKVGDKPRVFWYGYPDYYYPALKTTTALSGDHSVIINAGGINIAADLIGGTTVEVEGEWIVEQNPDVIIGKVLGKDFTGYSADETEAVENMKEIKGTLMDDPALSATKAVGDEKVFIMCTDLNKGGMHVVGTAYLAKYLHPELFEDIQPKSILEEYYEEWQGVPYQGKYVYQSP